MKGTCLKCGCTEERACETAAGTCFWIDTQEDLCGRCASELISGPIEASGLVEAGLVIRALRGAMFEIGARAQSFESLLERALVELGAAAPEQQSQIWTP